MKKYLLLIIVVFFVNCGVYAEELDLTFSCPKEIIAGNQFECTIDLTNSKNNNIKGLQVLYELEDTNAISYVDSSFNENWDVISANSNGLVVVNTTGITKSTGVATVKFITDSQIETGKSYNLYLKNIKVSDSEQDIDLTDKMCTIKVLTITELIDYISVNGTKLELKDGITNYEINVTEKIATVTAKLKNNNYEFADDYGPKTLKNLKVGDNLITLKIINADTKTEVINYTININYQETVDENPKTGSIKGYLISLVMFITAGILYYLNKNQFGGQNEK